VAASGDTILIGPGRYNEGRVVTTPGWTLFVRVVVRQAELTIIGAGPQQTIIGQVAPYDWSQGRHRGIEASPWFGNTDRLTVSGIRFENMDRGIIGAYSVANMDVSNCSFSGNYFGVFALAAASLNVRSCQFDSPGAAGDGRFIYTQSVDLVRIAQCTFTGTPHASRTQVLIQFDVTLDVEVSDCDFLDGGFGLSATGGTGSAFRVINSRFVGQSAPGMHVGPGSLASIEGCTFSQQKDAIVVAGSSTDMTITNCDILDVSHLAIWVDSARSLTISNSYLAHGPQYTIQEPFYCSKDVSRKLPMFDLTNNNWDTTDADSIAAWINMCHYDATFIPYIGQPVPTVPLSFGSLKAQFR